MQSFEHRFVPAPRALLAFANRKGSVLVSEYVPGENLHAFTEGGRGGRFATVLPTFFLLQCCWAVGELAGYVTGKP